MMSVIVKRMMSAIAMQYMQRKKTDGYSASWKFAKGI